MDSGDIAILISLVSLVVAGSSLGWQVAQWLLSGGRPKATLEHGVLYRGGVISGPVKRDGSPYDIRNLRSQGVEGPQVIGVQVTNHGRSPVVVDSLSLCLRGGAMRFAPQNELLGPELPHRIDAGSNQSWFVEAEIGERLVSVSRSALDERIRGVYIQVKLGTGKTINTSNTLRM